MVCPRGHRFAFDRGYLDLSDGAAPDGTTARTFESFGYEWNTFDDVRDEDSQFAEVYFRDLDMASLQGKIGLDAGCGKGRYTRFLAPHLDGAGRPGRLERGGGGGAQPRVLSPTSSWSEPTSAPSR